MCAQTQSVFWRRPAPHAGAGTYFRYEAKGKQRLAKGHLWNPFGEQLLTMETKAVRKALQ